MIIYDGLRQVQHSSMPITKWQAKMGNWHTKKYKKFGLPNESENGKLKYSWIAKTNSDGTPIFFPILYPVLNSPTCKLSGAIVFL